MSASRPPLAVAILAGGQGKRLGLDRPKVMAELCGQPALGYVLDTAARLQPEHLVVVACHQKEKVAEYLDGSRASQSPIPVKLVDQGVTLGTGHAVQKVLEALPDLEGDLLVLFGDSPLVRAETLQAMLEDHRQRQPSCTLLTAQLEDPSGYGRIVLKADGTLDRVVEHKDADAETRGIRQVHCGLAVFQAGPLRGALADLDNDNAQGEYYLTDAYQRLQQDGGRVHACPLEDWREALGYNTVAELLELRGLMRFRILERLTLEGVQIEDPGTTFIDATVEIGAGTRILPFSVIRGPGRIGRDCEVGPFSHLRNGTVLADGAEVGNFVEVKNCVLDEKVKAKHLSYLGDAHIGARTNIGAGTITANYDGKHKHRTEIGKDAFIGSGSILVAPAQIGDGATTGAGAVVTRGRAVADGSVVVGVPARELIRPEETSTAAGKQSKEEPKR